MLITVYPDVQWTHCMIHWEALASFTDRHAPLLATSYWFDAPADLIHLNITAVSYRSQIKSFIRAQASKMLGHDYDKSITNIKLGGMLVSKRLLWRLLSCILTHGSSVIPPCSLIFIPLSRNKSFEMVFKMVDQNNLQFKWGVRKYKIRDLWCTLCRMVWPSSNAMLDMH